MDSIMNILPWALVILGAAVTFLVKPLLLRGSKPTDEQAQRRQNKLIYITKIIGMWLVIIGAVMIFIAGGMYGRQ